MAIVVSQLISAAVLQLPFVDKQGDPLTNGVVTFYQSDMITLKNVYYQSGTPGNYTYLAAPNPMVLSGAGTPVDVNGNDIILFYYPYSETDSAISQPYFITVYDEFGTLQFTRSNFPFISGNSSATTIATLDNYVINNRFWRNIGSLSVGTLTNTWTTQYNNSGTVYYATLCPDQHDGFSMPDVNYIKNFNGNSTETITFNKFAETNTPSLTGDIGPEYYINHTCTADTSGSTLKVYQFPISLHLATLAAQPFSFTIQGQSISGNPTIGISIYQFCGTGATSPNPLSIGSITLGANWTKFTIAGQTFAGTVGLTLGSGADDAYYLQIEMPTGSVTGICNLNFTLPSIYLSSTLNDIPTNSFSTYDQIDTIINSSRTGDVRTSLNQFYPYGWVPMNNGTIGNASSNATSRANVDTWPLFDLLWTQFAPYNSSTTNLLAQMVSSGGSNVAYGASAIADFNANKALTLTQTMGKVILGTVPSSIILQTAYYSSMTVSNSAGNLLITGINNTGFFNGMPIYFLVGSGGILPTGLSLNTIYYVSGFSSGPSTFFVSTTFANALAGTVIAYTDSGTPTYSVISALPGSFEGEYAHTQLTAELAQHLHSVDSFTMTGTTLSPGASNATTGPGTFNTNNTGSSTPFNVTQPGVFFNLFMKL